MTTRRTGGESSTAGYASRNGGSDERTEGQTQYTKEKTQFDATGKSDREAISDFKDNENIGVSFDPETAGAKNKVLQYRIDSEGLQRRESQGRRHRQVGIYPGHGLRRSHDCKRGRTRGEGMEVPELRTVPEPPPRRLGRKARQDGRLPRGHELQQGDDCPGPHGRERRHGQNRQERDGKLPGRNLRRAERHGIGLEGEDHTRRPGPRPRPPAEIQGLRHRPGNTRWRTNRNTKTKCRSIT